MIRVRKAVAILSVAWIASPSLKAQTPPSVVVIAAEGTGFPFEDPGFFKYPSLKKLRGMSRPFDSSFSIDPAWRRNGRTLLGGGGATAPRLVAALRKRGYATTAIAQAGSTGFDRALPATPSQTGARVLDALGESAGKPAFIFATLDLRNLGAAGPPLAVDAPPLEVPAIALFDRGPLDPVRFPVTSPPRDPADRGALAARRDAAFRLLDREVGTILAGLEKRRELSRTILVLVSSGPAPRPERASPSRQDLLFEDWLRGLILISAPGIETPGTSASTLAVMADVAPTIASLAGAIFKSDDGVDLSAAVKVPTRRLRETLMTSAEREAPQVGRSVRSQRFRFTQWPDGSEELFDEEADPREWTNLARRPAMQAQRADLAKRLVLPKPPPPASAAKAFTSRRPNVLMIIGDDLTAQYAQFGEVKTPNLDRLRARGRSYAKAYAPAPFCTPSRAAFLSGMSPSRLELQRENAFADVFTPKIPLIQEQFRASGYFTASVGKVWDSQPGDSRGWDVNVWTPDLPKGAVESPVTALRGTPLEAGTTTNPDELEADGRRARLAVRLLEEKRDRPLFLALGFIRPHVAWIAPKKYFDLYPPERITFVPAPANDTADIPAIAVKNRPQELPGLMLAGREGAGVSSDPDEARRGIAAYLACLTFMDAQLGVVLDALDREDRWKDTIVVFFGDNGHHFGDHGGLWRKNTLFEDALRVPLVIATPDMPRPGSSTTALADLIDIFPTLVDLTGIARPGTLDGVSLAPTLNDPRASVQDTLIQYRPIEPLRRAYSLRTDKYRYTLWPDGSEELYDLAADPAGRRDLASRPNSAATVASLRRRIESIVLK